MGGGGSEAVWGPLGQAPGHLGLALVMHEQEAPQAPVSPAP